MKQKLKICVVLVDRANYGRLFPVMHELKSNKECILQTICSGTMMLEKFGYAERIVQKDGFKISGKQSLQAGTVESNDDHRIAMTAIVANVCINSKIEVDNIDCISDSYPSFFEDLFRSTTGPHVCSA